MTIKLLLLAFIILVFNLAMAQSTSTLMGSRAMGVGFTSSTLSDEWSLFNNVGGIGKLNQASASFAYEAIPALTGANRTAASVQTPTRVGTIGLGIFRFGDDVYSEHLVSFAFGNSIGNTSLGVKANYVQYSAESFGTTTNFTIDFGGVTQLTQQISIGAYITNLTRSKLSGSDSERLPTKLVTGLGFLLSEKLFVATELEKDLDYQATWRSGLEYAFYKKVFFRTGFNVNPNAAYLGLGAQKRNLKIDYAIKFSQVMGTAHQASVVYLFASRQKK